MTTRKETPIPQAVMDRLKREADLEARLAVAVEALEYILEHELYHGVNQGRLSEDIAREALAKIK